MTGCHESGQPLLWVSQISDGAAITAAFRKCFDLQLRICLTVLSVAICFAASCGQASVPDVSLGRNAFDSHLGSARHL
jgi:hypothetical protein